jgi:hypothetical protein
MYFEVPFSFYLYTFGFLSFFLKSSYKFTHEFFRRISENFCRHHSLPSILSYVQFFLILLQLFELSWVPGVIAAPTGPNQSHLRGLGEIFSEGKVDIKKWHKKLNLKAFLKNYIWISYHFRADKREYVCYKKITMSNSVFGEDVKIMKLVSNFKYKFYLNCCLLQFLPEYNI